MALLDEIKSRLVAQTPTVAQPSAQDTAVQTFLARSGKAVTGPGAPRASHVGENLAKAQLGAAQGQLAGKAAQAVAGLDVAQAAQTQQLGLAQDRLAAQRGEFQADLGAKRAQASAERAARGAEFAARAGSREALAAQERQAQATKALNTLASERGITVDDLFAQFKAGRQELAYRRDAADLEQRAHLLRSDAKDYMAKLDRIGRERRLNNDLQFRSETQELTLGAQLAAALKAVQFNIDLNADQRAWNEMTGSMTNDQALAIFTADAKDKTMTTTLSSVGVVAQGIASNYPKDKDKDKNKNQGQDQGRTTESTLS